MTASLSSKAQSDVIIQFQVREKLEDLNQYINNILKVVGHEEVAEELKRGEELKKELQPKKGKLVIRDISDIAIGGSNAALGGPMTNQSISSGLPGYYG